MQKRSCKGNRQCTSKLRLAVTLALLPMLAGGTLLVSLIDDTATTLTSTLAAILVGWVLTLILAERSPESSTSIINLDDDNSPSQDIDWAQRWRTEESL